MFTSIDPANGATVATFEAIEEEAVEIALVCAAASFKSWRASAIEQRTALLSAIADQFEANKQHLAETATREIGKTVASAVAEVEKCIAGFYYAKEGPRHLAPVGDRGGARPGEGALAADRAGAGGSCCGISPIGRRYAGWRRRSLLPISSC